MSEESIKIASSALGNFLNADAGDIGNLAEDIDAYVAEKVREERANFAKEILDSLDEVQEPGARVFAEIFKQFVREKRD